MHGGALETDSEQVDHERHAEAFASEGADVAISYLPEDEEDAQDTADWIRKAGQPAELAAAYVLLASEQGSNISGAVLPVTGGKGL